MRILKYCEKALITLFGVIRAFVILVKISTFVQQGVRIKKYVAFFVAQFWNSLVKKQCDSATEKIFGFYSFAVIFGFMQ